MYEPEFHHTSSVLPYDYINSGNTRENNKKYKTILLRNKRFALGQTFAIKRQMTNRKDCTRSKQFSDLTVRTTKNVRK